MFLSPDLVIKGYKNGIFPMAESSKDPYIFWVSPETRGIIMISDFRITKSLKKFIKKKNYKIKINKNFEKIILECARETDKRKDTWINQQIIDCYTNLYKKGIAISVECYDNFDLIGGLYGVSVGKVFFGESMFSKKVNASKVSLVYLAAFLKEGGYNFIDTQFQTDHLKQFGALEIKKVKYLHILRKNINCKAQFPIFLKKDVLDYFT